MIEDHFRQMFTLMDDERRQDALSTQLLAAMEATALSLPIDEGRSYVNAFNEELVIAREELSRDPVAFMRRLGIAVPAAFAEAHPTASPTLSLRPSTNDGPDIEPLAGRAQRPMTGLQIAGATIAVIAVISVVVLFYLIGK